MLMNGFVNLISVYSIKYKVYRTNNVMTRTNLILAKDNFDIKGYKIYPQKFPLFLIWMTYWT